MAEYQHHPPEHTREPPANLPSFLRFTPVPGKARHDGWSPARQFRFLLALARGAGVHEAARQVGRSRQTAYRLRTRSGAESFAAAWDAALAFAGEVRSAAAAASPAASASIQTLLVPRFYRGRLIGYVQREDLRGAMATLSRLDRLAAKAEADGRADALRALSEQFDRAYPKGDKGDMMRLANAPTMSPFTPTGRADPAYPYPLP
jgi:hypothetical protein